MMISLVRLRRKTKEKYRQIKRIVARKNKQNEEKNPDG